MAGSKNSLCLRPRFTLWAMLALITVVAIPLSYVAQRRRSLLDGMPSILVEAFQ
jgi:lipopolysaccharide export LptBFGC system permease protein LptF